MWSQSQTSQLHCLYLISVGVTTYDDGLLPTGDQARDVVADDGLSEDSAPQDVPDGAVGRLPHLLQLELCTQTEEIQKLALH